MLQSLAPDFCLPAYYQNSQQNICLNAYKGQWVLLLFYTSDFSFV